MRLRTSLLLLFAATAVPLLLAGAVAALFVFNQEQSTLVAAAMSRNLATIEAVDAELRGTVNLLNAFSTREDIVDAPAKFHAAARTVLASQPNLSNVVLLAPDGRQLANARVPLGTPLFNSPVDAASFGALIATGKPTIGNISFAPKLGDEPGVAVRVAVRRDGRVAAVITAVVRPAVFQQALERQQIPDGWVSGLVGTDGRFIARTPPVKVGTMASAAFLREVGSADRGWYRGKTVEGRDTYTAFAKSPLTQWSIGFAIPSEAVTGGPLRTAGLFMAGLMASVLAAAALGYWLLARVARPIRLLADAAPDLRQGVAPPPVANAVDEIAALADALGGAAASIRDKDEELSRQRNELSGQAEALRQVDANKTRFLAQVSHELRGPLGTLHNAVTLLEDPRGGAVHAQARATMKRQLRLLSRLVDDFIDLGRVERGHLDLALAPVILEDVVQACLVVHKPQFDAKQQVLSVTYAPGSLRITADADRLTQVVSNLLSNASRYTPEGGQVSIRLAREADQALIEVRDDGRGFSKADAERLFEMFVRLEGPQGHVQGSLGIGLSVTQAIVELHGGTIRASSEGPGLGAVFQVRLPLDGPARPEGAPSEAKVAPGL